MSNQLDLTFDTPESIDLYVENGRGSVEVTATDTSETTVRIVGDRAEEFDVRDLDDGVGTRRIAILAPKRSGGFLGREPRAEIVVEVPVASGLQAKVGSSDVTTHGRLGDTRVETGSGDVSVGRISRGQVMVRAASGDVAIGVPPGVPVWTDITSVSGTIRSTLPSAGRPADGHDHVEIRARTVSGDVHLAPA